ncbi:probable E3 ubiquitin-protein ligase makorin-1 isoform X2 [Melanotaenia boesemani]|uniref:probable E3 ubiquitin-protein ligase makorin-1 isoform X2 n=1 Tax=Melanotaenia boesemani TaxID=1250792 RepID=UPI001C041AB1|nr:probable E3 ubiquitin-protein ligase makorin-1 isoform X2 [Melanotaenia boesemani]
MAEAAASSTAASSVTGGWTKHVTCRYFMHGLCKEGDNCRYSHDLTNSKPAAMICKFFQNGNCVFGDRCRFEHSKPIKKEELPTSQTLPLPSALPAAPSDPEPCGLTPGSGAQDWVNAAEFVPGQPYCGRAEPVQVESSVPLIEDVESDATQDSKDVRNQLCPYAAVGECRYGLNCAYLHGDVCDMCGLQVLHPTDNAQRSEHTKACIEAHEKDMEISFAIQRSKDMMCGVCMEVVFEKSNPSERRFGILSNCSHCYCLKCIRKWRSAKQFESKIIKSCPECRITSNFVIPSEYWVEDKDDKQKLIQKYKDGMGSKPCRYFDEGRGTCPFGSNCFYKHAFPDGRLEEAQPQRRQTGSNSRNRNSRRTPLWDIFDERESTDSFDNDDEEMVTFELSEMLLMLLAAGTDDDITDSEDEWDLFHEELDDFYEIYL